MTSDYTTLKGYLRAAQIFEWATKEHYALYFTGSEKRHRRTERVLPKLVQQKKLISAKYGKRLVYSAPRQGRNKEHLLFIEHGLGCTEGLIRFFWGKMNCEIIPERFFKGCGSVPEWGIRYSDGKMLLFEFSTSHDFHYSNKIRNKLAAYRKNLENINNKFSAESIILFVFDVPREKVVRMVEKLQPLGTHVFFTDYTTFKNVPIRKQFEAPIYIWGRDGKSYPLQNND